MARVFGMVIVAPLMIVANLDLERIAVHEPKADAPLVVDTNGVLPSPVALERVQPIAWRNPEVVETRRQVHVLQLAGCSRRHVHGKTLCKPGKEEIA